jgi:NitT/TauT family transport system permease protein
MDLVGIASPAATATGPSLSSRAWASTWPKLAAVGIALVLWELVVLARLTPASALPAPVPVLKNLWHAMQTGAFYESASITLGRAAVGYLIAGLVGSLVGIAVARAPALRSALGSLITGLQTMPSVVWLPFAILLFQRSEPAILFVVVLGAAPSIANGFISGIDHVPPEMIRAGRVLGARGLTLYRAVILPASLPSLLSGLKQGWAFAWRGLMAGELLIVAVGHPSIGANLQRASKANDVTGLLAIMIVILAIGIVVDGIFTAADRYVRQQRGLVGVAA